MATVLQFHIDIEQASQILLIQKDLCLSSNTNLLIPSLYSGKDTTIHSVAKTRTVLPALMLHFFTLHQIHQQILLSLSSEYITHSIFLTPPVVNCLVQARIAVCVISTVKATKLVSLPPLLPFHPQYSL